MMINGKSFSKQYRKCSRSCTHGQAGTGHGPYWYKSSPSQSLQYVGKDLPAPVVDHLALLKYNSQYLKTRIEELRSLEAAQFATARHTSALLSAVERLVSGSDLDKPLLDELGLGEYFILV